MTPGFNDNVFPLQQMYQYSTQTSTVRPLIQRPSNNIHLLGGVEYFVLQYEVLELGVSEYVKDRKVQSVFLLLSTMVL